MSNRSISRQSTAQELWDELVDLQGKYNMSQKYLEDIHRDMWQLQHRLQLTAMDLRTAKSELEEVEQSNVRWMQENLELLRERDQLRAQIVAAAEMCRKLETDADCGGVAVAIWEALEPSED